jgi:hypothetical protein
MEEENEDILVEGTYEIEHETSTNTIIYSFFGNISHELFLKFSKEFLAFQKKTKAQKIIGDISKLEAFSEESTHYNDQVLIPAWEKVGVKKNAVIIPEKQYKEYVLEMLKRKFEKKGEILPQNQKFEVKITDSIENALTWMAE